MSKEEFRSRVYTDRPAYADFDAPHKFEAIKSIIAKRLVEHPNAIRMLQAIKTLPANRICSVEETRDNPSGE